MGSPPASWQVDSFRVRGDGTEAAGNWLDALNTNVTIDPATTPIFIVRWGLTSGGGATGGVAFEYSKNGGAFTLMSTSSSNVKFVDSTNLTGDYTTTQQITSGTFVWGTTAGSEDGGVTMPSSSAGNRGEIEAVLSIVDADTSPGDTIVIRPGPTNITTHNQTLTITVGPLATGPPVGTLSMCGLGR